MEEKFLSFLDENDARAAYQVNYKGNKQNARRPMEVMFQKQLPVNWFNDAFVWAKTPEGQKFWQKLDTKWLRLIKGE